MLEALLARFSGADAPPSLVSAGCETRLTGDLAALAGNPTAMQAIEARADDGDEFWGTGPTDWRCYFRPYVVRDGVLQIPVKGALLADCSISYGPYVTGYGYIARAFARGLADGNVKGIAFLCDSYGGHVARNFDLVDKIYAGRGKKPIRAFAHEHAFSAAYSIASAADRVVISRTGGVGSIGVLTGHRDVSKQMEAWGIKYTFIFAGKHKVDGNSFEPLPDDVKARMQARIDALYSVFCASVARNRGMADEAVRATEALTYTADEAIAAGLADEIGSLEDAVAAFAGELNQPIEDTEQMSTPTDTAPAAGAPVVDTAAVTAAHAAGAAEAAARVSAILADDRSKGRERAALNLAAKSPTMSAEDVLAFVAETVPVASAAPAGSRLDQVMSDTRVSTDEASDAGYSAEASFAAVVDRDVARR